MVPVLAEAPTAAVNQTAPAAAPLPPDSSPASSPGLFKVLRLEAEGVYLLDQTTLPGQLRYEWVPSAEAMVRAIKTMIVRGAPAIGIAGAFGLVLAAREAERLLAEQPTAWPSFKASVLKAEAALRQSRPTAVNLMWALDAMLQVLAQAEQAQASISQAVQALQLKAQALHDEDIAANQALGQAGASFMRAQGLRPGARVLTHCNAGALATAGYGTALGVIRSLAEQDPTLHVYVDETRPRLQGAKLTAWELQTDGIPYTLISDNMAGWLMQQGRVDAIVVGADRIAANGDTANKIGTYSLAVLAQAHQVPFYVAAPSSTFDLACPNGFGIPIEERSPSEVTDVGVERLAPAGAPVYNPAFDVTPSCLVRAFFTEQGVLQPPYLKSLAALKA